MWSERGRDGHKGMGRDKEGEDRLWGTVGDSESMWLPRLAPTQAHRSAPAYSLPPLASCRYPSLVPRYKESFVAGNDVFHKFSAYIKNPLPAQDEGEGLSRQGWTGGHLQAATWGRALLPSLASCCLPHMPPCCPVQACCCSPQLYQPKTPPRPPLC